MGTNVSQLYLKIDDTREYCFNVESSSPLTEAEMTNLRLVLADGFLLDSVAVRPNLVGERVVEMGPRLNFATAWSSNMVSICQAIGLAKVCRVERSRRYLVPAGEELQAFISANHDRMTECPYPEPLTTFETGVTPEPVYEIDLKAKGPDGLLEIPGISMDEWDRNFYYDYFVKKHDRNPTIVEIMDLNNANSEHSRHGFFRGRQIIDGEEQPNNLFQLVTSTLTANPAGSLIAFKDNSSAVQGHRIKTIMPENPGRPCRFVDKEAVYHVLLTAETHNFPTGVAPFPGAETGTGGRLRDVQGTGQGGFV
ncbi:MAG: phosphoribosylformylglycinamidine synthase, partial [Desulfobulbaceae bacterium]|nr:phosphoribosylformylglycinamidine synthase [Desulfobulbaceae bacterium]